MRVSVKLDHETLGIFGENSERYVKPSPIVILKSCFDSGKFGGQHKCVMNWLPQRMLTLEKICLFLWCTFTDLISPKEPRLFKEKNTHFQKAVWQKKSARLKEKKEVDASHKMVDWNLNMSTWKDGMFQDSRWFFHTFSKTPGISTPSTHGFLHGFLFFPLGPTESHSHRVTSPNSAREPPNSLTHETPSLAPKFRLQHQMRQHPGTLWICFLVFFLVPRIAVFSQLFGDGIWLVEDASQTWHQTHRSCDQPCHLTHAGSHPTYKNDLKQEAQFHDYAYFAKYIGPCPWQRGFVQACGVQQCN